MILIKRYCEQAHNFCYSTNCLEKNFCGLVAQGICKSVTADSIALAKLYNDPKKEIK